MTIEQFINKVAFMRRLQKEYFAGRDPQVLRKSKAVEAEVDREIKRFHEERQRVELEEISPRLFDDNVPLLSVAGSSRRKDRELW